MRSTLGVLVRCLDGRADGEPTDRDLRRRYAAQGAASLDVRADCFREAGPGVWEWKLAGPLTVAKGVLTVAVKDKRGNATRIERRFSAGS